MENGDGALKDGKKEEEGEDEGTHDLRIAEDAKSDQTMGMGAIGYIIYKRILSKVVHRTVGPSRP